MFDIEIPKASQEALEAVMKRKDALRSISEKAKELGEKQATALKNYRPPDVALHINVDRVNREAKKRLDELKGD